MATFKHTGGVSKFCEKLVNGMTANGYTPKFAEKTFRNWKGLAPTILPKATPPRSH